MGEAELSKEQIGLLKNAFDTFDVEKKGSIGTVMIGTILSMLGIQTTDQMLRDIINEVDADGSGELEFEEFITLASRFMVEEDAEAMQQELKEAFRLYDKEGNGYITTSTLKEILKELDDKLTSDELDMMIAEIDSDGSGTVDFDVLKQIFDSFDIEKKGEINIDMIGQILDMLGHQLTADELQAIILEIDEDGNGVMNFDEFAHLSARFLMEEEEDTEAILRELKDAFRLYDKEGLGYIGVDLLRDILRELEPALTPTDLNEMIKEIDTDNSGTVDWDEFKAMMIG